MVSPAFALSEPEAGSDPAGMKTTAVLDGEEWVINGTKNWISNLGVADFYICFAVTDRERPDGSPPSWWRPTGPGFSVGKLEHKLGIRASPTGQPIFEDVRVPQANVIGEVGRGLSVALGTLRADAPGRGGAGRGDRAGRHRLCASPTRASVASSANRSSSSRRSSSSSPTWKRAPPPRESCCTRHARWPISGDPQRGKYSSMAKVFCSDTAMAVTIEAVQVLGGYGYVKEYPVERMMRDAKITQIYEGTNEIQRLVIARTLK